LRKRVVSMSNMARDPDNCITANTKDNWCLNWPHYARLKVEQFLIESNSCFRVVWIPASREFTPYDCLQLTHAHWFGGAEFYYQRWPLKDFDIPMQPFVSHDLVVDTKSFGNVLEPIWINIKGVGVTVDDKTPLFVSVDEGGSSELCLKADHSDQYFSSVVDNILNYTIYKARNAREIYHLLHSLVLVPPVRRCSRCSNDVKANCVNIG